MSNYESIFDNDSVRVKLADTEDGIALSLDFMEGDESTAGTTLYIGQEQIDGMCAWLEKYRSRPEVARRDPGTEKILWNLLDRAYKMMLMAIGPVHEQDSDSNDPIVAWASDVRKVLYGSGRVPSLADIASIPSPLRQKPFMPCERCVSPNTCAKSGCFPPQPQGERS